MDFEAKDYSYSVSKIEFFEEWFKHGKSDQNSVLFQFLSAKYDLSGITEDSLRDLKNNISRFSSKLSEKWTKCGKNRERFMKNNAEWITGEIVFHVSVFEVQPSISKGSTPGRPRKEFNESSDKTKKRRVADLISSRSSSELLSAAEAAARLSGHRNLATVIKTASKCPEKCKEMKSVNSECKSEQRSLTREEALAYYVDSKSTSHSYKQTWKWSMKAGHQVFPSLYSVRKAKVECFPCEDQITVNETRVEINLQAILDKTVERLVIAQGDVLKNLSSNSSLSSLTLTSKWGCDGSSGHSTYKQKFSSNEATDEFLFVFSFVPIQLRDVSGNIVWQNPRPSSTMYCRPIKFIFSKESTDFTVSETNSVLEEINSLQPTKSSVDGVDGEISVKHELLFTMIDGKVCNAVTETASSQTCYICKATPKVMNDESKEFVANRDNLGFGLSTLHVWIRCFECLLHISYRLEIKKWQVQSKEDQAKVKQRSADIQNRFKAEMGLIVDKPKPGYGNTNDGNTARRFFRNPEQSAEITGLDVNLIKMFDTMLRALSSGYDIDIDKFVNFTQKTRKLYLSLYSWYYMPATVHKLLVHSADIIQSALLPIGQLSEEAQEARNKDCRRFRENNTRKQSRIATNRDLLNMLLITSDPIINSLREVPKRKTGSLPSDVLNLLLPPNENVNRSIGTRISNDYVVNDSSEEEFSDND